jgi:hypothetical protein
MAKLYDDCMFILVIMQVLSVSLYLIKTETYLSGTKLIGL